MNKPEDIPQDVWNVADKLVAAVVRQALHGIAPDSQTLIARAIMAAKTEEREACAELLECGVSRDGVTHKTDECSHGRFGYEDCEMCAAVAIRKRGE